MKKFHNLLIKIKSYIKTFFYLIQKEKKIDNLEVKLNLGCGNEYKDGWVNIDVDKSVRTDICCDFMNLKKYFKPNSVDLIYMIHSISYLNLWESLLFFEDALDLLKKGGRLELEFPDIKKCSKIIVEYDDKNNYLEAVRAIYAFDFEQIKNKEQFKPYSFGWSSFFMKKTLQEIGFSEINIFDPETHGQRIWRDSKLIAIK